MTLLSKVFLTYALTYCIGLVLYSIYCLSSVWSALEIRGETAIMTFFSLYFISLGLGEILTCRGPRPTSFEAPKSFLRTVLLMRLFLVFMPALWNDQRWTENALDRIDCDQSKPNTDIVGSGVRCSMYILLLFVFVSLFVATFHRQESGTKELGCSVLINLCAMSLSLAMVKPNSFTPTDYLAVVLMIDTQCVALSATLSSKDALASRFYVGFTILGQTLAWAVVLYANHVLASSFSPAANSCIATYWVHSSFGGARPFPSFKIYWYIHALDSVHSGWLALCHTFQFDQLDKIDREQRRSHTGSTMELETGFNSLRGTPFSNWIGFALHPTLLIVTLETHMKSIETAAWGDWGQMMPLTMLVLGVGHWFYLNLTQLWAYIKDRTPGSDDKLWIPLDSSRMIAMGFGPSETGEVVHRLLTAKRSDA